MTNKLILVILDGCTYHAATENLGYLEHLVTMGMGSKFRVQGELPSLSRPMYETIMTGLPVCKHGITNNLTIRLSDQVSLFDLCRLHKLSTAAAAYYWFSELYVSAPFVPTVDRLQLSGDAKINYGIYYFEDHYPDSHVYSDAEYLRRQFNPDFLLVHPMNIDDAGHRFGGTSSQYHQAVAMENVVLASVIPLWLEAGYQVMVTADHGMNEHCIHGGNSELQRMVPLYLFSEKTTKGFYTEQSLPQLMLAPIICRLLGFEPPEKMKSLSEMEGVIFEA